MSYRQRIAEHYYSTTAARGGMGTQSSLAPFFAYLGHKIANWLPKSIDLPVLDLGCGCGELLLWYQSLGFTDVRGIDLSEEELQICRRRGLHNVQNKDIRSALKGHINTFELISAFNILEHLTKQEVVEVLTDIHSALRPGGRLIAVVPNAQSPLASQSRYWDYTHECSFTTNNWHQLAALVGFAAPRFREWGPYPHGIVSLFRFCLWHCLRIGIMLYNLVETASLRGGIYTQDMIVMLCKPDSVKESESG